ncbi:Probable phospholipid ABC transporter-binding protein MlaD [Serratia symbiotica]|nr:Probable phospholipid ABC transporter-binding protein MlaD [Serratia symbiotica]
MQIKKNEIWIGACIVTIICIIILIYLNIINIKFINKIPTYRLYATFDNIGELKINSPVKIGGIIIGHVANIQLDTKTYMPRITLDIQETYKQIPDNSILSIYTNDLLGEQYLALKINFEDLDIDTTLLKDGGTIHNTKSAIILEEIINQFIYKNNNDNLEDIILKIIKTKSEILNY